MTSWWSHCVGLLIALSLFVSNISAKSWWETGSFYQIYPRSFKDSNGDGIGDLNGVTSKLEYLKEIQIAGTWLSPIFTSPMADFGYDIANFTEIDPIFGTMEDFERMLAKAKQLGIRIILDFVPNHSSDECEWFIKSAERDPEYKDFYIWHPGKVVDGVRRPPTNWKSVFRGSAWEWHEGRKEYYLHQFDKKQPDFNFRNPKVRETLNDILRFWLEKGVDGFRVDAIPHAFEVETDENGDYPDEPRNELVTDPDDYGYTKHIYTCDLPETPHLVYEWRKVLEDFKTKNGGDDRILMIEAWSEIDTAMKYYGNGTAKGGQIPFNFQLISFLQKDSTAYQYAELINLWLSRMPAGEVANWVIGNHDKNRVGSRFGKEHVDLFNILLLMLPGISITYMGDEIGMLDAKVSWKETVDPQACNGPEEGFDERSRDPERSPFQWSDEKNAGFTNGSYTWLPIGDNYKTMNVKKERRVALSHLAVFKELQQIRSSTTIQNGDSEIKALSRNILAVKRYLKSNYTYVSLLNIFDHLEYVDLTTIFEGISKEFEYVLITDKSARRKGDKVSSNRIVLMPYECIVLRSTTTTL